MDIGDLKTKIEELADNLRFAATQTEQAVEELKAVKDVEIGLKESADRIKKQSEDLEARIAKTVTERVLANLDPFFENSQKIRESAEAIHQVDVNIQNYAQQNCGNKIKFALIGGLVVGILLYHFLEKYISQYISP